MKLTKKQWLKQKVMCDEWGRPPSLADVPLTIMTRKEALLKQGGDEKSIDKLYNKIVFNDNQYKEDINAEEEN